MSAHWNWLSPYAVDAPADGWQEAASRLAHALARRVDLDFSQPITAPADRAAQWASRLLTVTRGRRRVWSHSDKRLSAYAGAVDAATRTTAAELDFFFGTAEFLRTVPTRPYACYTDSAFVPFLEWYHDSRHYPLSERERLAHWERGWLAAARHVFVSSDFAGRAVIDRYGLPPCKVSAVGIGANIDDPGKPGHGEPGATVLLMATDFDRKGGPLAVAACERAQQMIPDLKLHVIGQDVPEAYRRPFVVSHGWVDKAAPEGRSRLRELMAAADLCLLLSSADLTPIAICEAFAYAVPPLALGVGGVPEMVRDGQTGWVLSPDADDSAVAQRLAAVLNEPGAAAACGEAARTDFENRWNWDAVADRIVTQLGAQTA